MASCIREEIARIGAHETNVVIHNHHPPEVTTLRKPYSQAELIRTLRECLDA